MIEHFEKFNDYGKGLLPLSFSHLNEFAFYRERWALRRIFGYEFPTSAPAIRGQVVESGINMFLNGIPIEEASEKMIAELADNWELDRIAKMDVILMKMAITELQIFNNIPTKVTLNEYIEISKFYSTPKSNGFINSFFNILF